MLDYRSLAPTRHSLRWCAAKLRSRRAMWKARAFNDMPIFLRRYMCSRRQVSLETIWLRLNVLARGHVTDTWMMLWIYVDCSVLCVHVWRRHHAHEHRCYPSWPQLRRMCS